MSNTETPSNLPAITPEIAKAKISLELTTAELSVQAIQTRADKLVYNEDNLTEINEVITGLKAVGKKIDEAHKAGKAPSLAEGNAWDAAKRDLVGLISPILEKVTKEHTKLCKAVEKRRRENEAAEAKKKATEEAITAKILGFSQEITACKTNKDLIAVESRINLEKTRTLTYGDQLSDLIERCNGLNELLKTQKAAVKELEGLQAAAETAIATGNDELLQEIEEKKEEVTGQIQETKVRVEERAINSSIRTTGGGGYTQTFPEVKAKRRTWKYEVKDLAALYKKFPHLITLTLNDEAIKEILKGKVMDGETKDKEEIDYMGVIRFYVDKKY